MTALAPDFHPDYHDTQEALAEWRAFMNLLDPSQDEFWRGVMDAPAYIPPEKECAW